MEWALPGCIAATGRGAAGRRRIYQRRKRRFPGSPRSRNTESTWHHCWYPGPIAASGQGFRCLPGPRTRGSGSPGGRRRWARRSGGRLGRRVAGDELRPWPAFGVLRRPMTAAWSGWRCGRRGGSRRKRRRGGGGGGGGGERRGKWMVLCSWLLI